MKALIFLVFLCVSTAWAHESLETESFKTVAEKVFELKNRYGAREVLVVLDIDNTLLRANQPLGSDQWFEWQSDAIKKNSSEASFKTFEDLLQTQAIFFQIAKMSPTEVGLPQFLAGILRSGPSVFLLTSRSPDLRLVTERELKRNGYSFENRFPLRDINLERAQAPFKNPVSFSNGIFMTSGHHKGEALKFILNRSGKRYRAIVFVDDHKRHTDRVYETFSTSQETEVITFRYSHEDSAVESFKKGSKSAVLTGTKEFQLFMNRYFK